LPLNSGLRPQSSAWIVLVPLINRVINRIRAERKWAFAQSIYRRYQDFTMIPADIFSMNILLCQVKSPETGCIVEAGVWRGGMSAGMSDAKPGRLHYLFDSFDGLPPAKEIDGPAALQWQQNGRFQKPLAFWSDR
jgi:hypothetical protein